MQHNCSQSDLSLSDIFFAAEVNMNLTDLYDMLIRMSEELRETKQELGETKQRQLTTEAQLNATEKELKATRKILDIGNVM